MLNLPIYLDYAATTPVDEQVIKRMIKYCSWRYKLFGNPDSYNYQSVQQAIYQAKLKIATLINADPEEIYFTSGATESNNLLLKGLLLNKYNKNYEYPHVITTAIEHKSILNCCKYLENMGINITYLNPNKYGIITTTSILNAIKPNTKLISIIHINNELGIIQNLSKIGNICKKFNILFHIDAVQSLGKVIINVKKLNINFLSGSAHKIYGPKGIGFLFISNHQLNLINTQIHGGNQQNKIRSGTLPVQQIVGMGEACRIAKNIMTKEQLRIELLRNLLCQGLKPIKQIYLNTYLNNSIPNILNISIKNLNANIINNIMNNLTVSFGGAACNNNINNLSHVLIALGINHNLIKNSIRISLGRYTTKEEIIYSIKHIYNSILKK